MHYKETIPFFSRVASHGIPIRDPKEVKEWARKELISAFTDFSRKYPNTVSGLNRPEILYDIPTWERLLMSNEVVIALNGKVLARLWEKNNLPKPTPYFTFSPEEYSRLSEFDGCAGFAGDLFSLYKKRQRYSGLCGAWLNSYRDGRLWYGSLHPFGCSTGRCAPCASEGFLPSMGREVTKALLCPPKGRCITILDYKAQGLCIMSALSGDPNMRALARAKDPYLGLGMLLGLITKDDYDSLTVQELKARFSGEREKCKKLMLAYQYGAQEKALGATFGNVSGRELKKTLDKLFASYLYWKRGITVEAQMPDGFTSRAKNATVAHVQGMDAYILRYIITHISLPDDVNIIATNNDCLWVEHPVGYDTSSIATFMESVANELCGVKKLFRVDIETI